MKRKKKKKIIKEKFDWQRLIALSAAGKYIQDRFNEELKKYKGK